MKMKCIVVDDEPIALQGVADYVRETPFLELIAFCNNAHEATKVLAENKIDLIFTDIEMPRLNGIQMVNSLYQPPMVIFITAYPNFAVKGFELNAVDYILKPISYESFLKSSQKALKLFTLTNQKSSQNIEFIFVKVDKRMVKVNITDILYIEGLKDYISIFCKTKRLITHLGMSKIQDALPSNQFTRVHKSFIVNNDAITAFDGASIEIDRKSIPIGRTYKPQIMNTILGDHLLKK
jgi:DNA-binding LytR/AlgR family response regulator